MFRAAVPAIVAVLVLTSVVRAEIVDPVFVRGSRLNPPVSYASGVKYDTLTAFNSAADMAAFANGFGSYRMGGNRQWGWDRWKFFDGTNYYRVQWQDASPWKLYNYGSNIYRLLNDSTNLLDPQDFAAPPRGVDVDPADSMINFFADTDGAIYQVWQSERDLEFTNKVTKFDSIADLLAGTGTDFDSVEYRWGDNFIGLNGKFYRTNSEPEPEEQGGRIAESSVFGIAEYDSFADLLAGTSSAVYGGGDGLAWDLFMAVPKAHLTHLSSSVGGTPPVPEIDPAGMGSVLALVGGVLGLLERRRTRAGRTHTRARPMPPLRNLATLTSIMLALGMLGSTNAHAVSIDMATVGNQGNVGQTHNYGSFGGSLTFGAVNHSYRIGKHEVTISQYTAFLNAVAATDTYSLYNAAMASEGNISGIRQNGSSGSYTYSVIGSPDRPITYVSWFDAARFANWMSNGQGSGGTETGAYTLAGATTGNAVARNPGATFSLPTEDEWFKAAYYSPLLNSGAGGYYAYATQFNDAPGNQIIAGAPNQANYAPGGVYSVTQSSSYSSGQNYLTNVGAFTGSPSFYGTFDQSGNVTEWNDLTGSAGSARGLRGGDWNDFGSPFGVSFTSRGEIDPAVEFNDVGFRLVSPVPEIDPASMGSVLALVASALGLLERRRKSA